MLTQSIRPDVRLRENGEEVWFREVQSGKWHGPGVVRGYDSVQQQYEVASGSRTYRPGRYDVKGREEFSISDTNPRFVESEEVRQGGREAVTEKKPGDAQATAEARDAEAADRERRELT